MKSHLLPVPLFFVLAFLSPQGPSHGGEAKKDLDKMQGAWVVDTLIERGKKPPAEEVQALEVHIQNNVLMMKEKGKTVAEFKIKLDSDKKPKTLDLSHTVDKEKEQIDIGIYEVEGDIIRLCVDEEGKERPKEFISTEKSTFSLIVLKRKK